MGHNDHIEEQYFDEDLPAEAGDQSQHPFEPNRTWIEGADKDQQIAAMRRWFLDRYEDPVMETPYHDGAYVFVWGGPYDPNDVIQEEFSDVVEYDVMAELINDLWSESGDEWAPIEHEGVEYGDFLSFHVEERDEPYEALERRLAAIKDTLKLKGPPAAVELATQLAHSAVITALESYLLDTTKYWIENDEETFKRFVTTNTDLADRGLKLSEIFDRSENLRTEVEEYIQGVVWHRLDKIKPVLSKALQLDVPDISDLMREIVMRHDVIHRGGRTKDGTAVSVNHDDVERAINLVDDFAKTIENDLKKKYPEDF